MKKVIAFLILAFIVKVTYGQTTFIAVASGNWNATGTWSTDGFTPIVCAPCVAGMHYPSGTDDAMTNGQSITINGSFSVRDFFVEDIAGSVVFVGPPLTVNGVMTGWSGGAFGFTQNLTNNVFSGNSRVLFTAADLSNGGQGPNDFAANYFSSEVLASWNSNTPIVVAQFNLSNSATIDSGFGSTVLRFTQFQVLAGDLSTGFTLTGIEISAVVVLTSATSAFSTTVPIYGISGISSSMSQLQLLNGSQLNLNSASAYINASTFVINSTSTLSSSFSGSNQTEGWWYQTSRPASFSINSSSTITFNGNSAQNIPSTTYGNLTLDSPTNPFVKTLSGTGSLVVQGNFIVNSGNVTLTSTNTNEAIFQGNIMNNGTWTTTVNQDIRFSGSTTQTIAGSNAITFNDNVIFANASGVDFDVDVTFASTITDNNNPITFSEDFTYSGTTYNQGSGNITFDGASQQIAGAGDINFNNIILDGATLNNNGTNVSLSGLLSATGTNNIDFDGAGSGSFTLISDASGTASVGDLSTTTVGGNIIFQRYFDGTGDVWRNFGVAVNGATVTNITSAGYTVNGSDLAFYNESADVWEDQNSFGSSLSNTRGYSIYTRTEDGENTVSFTGTLNKGNQNMTVTNSGSGGDAGWNLVNNPFASTIDWDLVTPTNLDGFASIWDGTQYLTVGSGADITTGYISSGQSFWTHSSGGTPTLTITEGHKVSNSAIFQKNETEEFSNRLIVTLSDEQNTDKTYIWFRSESTSGLDSDYDALKRSNSIFNLSSIDDAGSVLSVNSMGDMDSCDKSVALNITNIQEGTYNLKFDEVVTFAHGVKLVDSFTGNETPILEGQHYSFEVTADAASYGSERFELEFSAVTLQTDLSSVSINECSSDLVSIIIDNAQNGITYELKQGDEIIKTEIATGSNVEFDILKSSLNEGVNEYDVAISNGHCGSAMADTPLSLEYFGISEISAVLGGSTCGTNSISISASGASDNEYYKWYESIDAVDAIVGANSATFDTPVLSASKTYFVSIINKQGCESLNRVAVSAEIKDEPVIPDGIESTIDCRGDDALISIPVSQLGADYTLKDSFGEFYTVVGTGGQVTVSVAKSNLANGINTFDLSVDNGFCSDVSASEVVTIDYAPIVEVEEVTSQAHCGVGSLTINASGASEGDEYRWYESLNGVEPISGENAASLITPELETSKAYYVTVVNKLGCESTTRVEVNATIYDLPEIPEITPEGEMLVSSVKEGNQWYKDGVLIEGATDNTYEVAVSGSYAVEVGDTNGCKSISESRIMVITSTFQDFGDENMSIYPNPLEDEALTISSNSLSSYQLLKIFDKQGKSVLSEEIKSRSELKIDMSQLNRGIYFIHLTGKEGSAIYKILKN